MAKSKYLLYEDFYVSLFNDVDKTLSVYVSRGGHTRVINYDYWYYTYMEDIEAYNALIQMETDSDEERQEYLGNFIKWLEKQLGDGDVIDYDELKEKGFRFYA